MSRRRSVSMTSLRAQRSFNRSTTDTSGSIGSPGCSSASSFNADSDPRTSASSLKSSSSRDSNKTMERLNRRQKNLAKKRLLKEKKREEKIAKKLKENKIGKEDYYNKRLEFRTWLLEEKKKRIETLSDSKSKEYFKKFVKKWNNNKLAKKYYRGINPCWINGSPCPELQQDFQEDVVCTPSLVTEESLDEKYGRAGLSSSFGTFGKRLRKQKQNNRNQVMSFHFEDVSSDKMRKVLDGESYNENLNSLSMSQPALKVCNSKKKAISQGSKEPRSQAASSSKRITTSQRPSDQLRKKLFCQGLGSTNF